MIRAAQVGLGWWGKTLIESVQGTSDKIRFVAATSRTKSDDYLAFARALVGDGPDATRLLRRETLALMTSNQLTWEQRSAARMFGRPIFADGHGYGMGVAVVLEPEKADPRRCRGGVGTIGWPGAYGGWWQADPNDGSVLIFLTHNMLELPQMMRGIGLGVWEAITEFHAVATARA